MPLLTRMEELLLLAVWNLQEKAYGLAVRRQLSELLGRKISVGAVYVPLERLVRKGMLSTEESEPTQKRGGRRKRFYRLTAQGRRALLDIRTLHEEAWSKVIDPGLNPSPSRG